jgi:hypothetical protein
MSIDLLNRTNDHQGPISRRPQPSVSQAIVEPDLNDKEQFEGKMAQLQQTQTAQSDNTATDKIITDKEISVSKSAENKEPEPVYTMADFYNGFRKSILIDIVKLTNVEFDKD